LSRINDLIDAIGADHCRVKIEQLAAENQFLQAVCQGPILLAPN
jgi:hypothetical protein